MSRSLRWSVGLAALLTVAIGSIFGVTYWLGTSALSQAVDAALLEQLELLATRPPELLPTMITTRMNHQPAVITQVGLFDDIGRLIVGDLTSLPADFVADGKVRLMETAAGEDGLRGHLHVAVRTLADGRRLAVARDVTGLLQMQETLMATLIFSVIAAAIVSLCVGTWFGIRSDRRLANLRSIAGRIVDGALYERLPESQRADELDQLSGVMNSILDRLEALVEAWKNVGEDIAHDMRTPLTAVRARLERAREQGTLNESGSQAVDRALLGIDEALSVMSALLRIAEIEKGRRREKFRSFDLSIVIAETGDTFLPLAEDAGVELTVKPSGPVAITGDRELIVEMIVNLVDNAVKFAGRGASVSLELRGTSVYPIIAIEDNGPGIPANERDAVFRRFYRAEPSRSTPGSGLGLALVASVVRLHEFQLRLSDAEPGCLFEVRCWPISANASSPDDIKTFDQIQ